MPPQNRSRFGRRPIVRALVATLAAGLARPARAEELQRIMVVGDSQAQGLAGGLVRMYRGDRQHRVIDRSKISTGLVPRPNYDWPAMAPRLAAADRPDVAVVMFGANDRPPPRVSSGMDLTLTQGFRDTYGASVRSVAAGLAQGRCTVIWVGHPIVRDPVFAEDIAMLNELYQEYAVPAGAEWLSTWNSFQAPGGGYTPYGRGADGEMTKLRADDGVHLTPAGYDVIARLLQPMLDQRLFG